MQSNTFVEPSRSCEENAGQLLQICEFGEDEFVYVELGHNAQDVAPETYENFPFSHSTHVVSDFAPMLTEYFPIPQSVHKLVFDLVENFPA